MMVTLTIDQFTTYVPALVGSQIEDIQPHVDAAKLWLKNYVVGDDLYNAGNSDSGVNTDYLNLLRKTVSLIASVQAIPELDLAYTTNGFVVTSNPNQAPASKDRVKNLIAKLVKRRDNAIDELIEYLYNREGLKNIWQDSPQFKSIFEVLIYSPFDLSKYINQNIDRELYMKLKSAMIIVEKTKIEKAISKDYLNIIREAQKEDSLSPEALVIFSTLKRAICELTLASAIDNLSVIIDGDGVFRSYEIGKTSYADMPTLKTLAAQKQRIGMDLLNDVVNVMIENIDDYTEYADSDEYTNKTTYPGFTNSADNSIFVSNV